MGRGHRRNRLSLSSAARPKDWSPGVGAVSPPWCRRGGRGAPVNPTGCTTGPVRYAGPWTTSSPRTAGIPASTGRDRTRHRADWSGRVSHPVNPVKDGRCAHVAAVHCVFPAHVAGSSRGDRRRAEVISSAESCPGWPRDSSAGAPSVARSLDSSGFR